MPKKKPATKPRKRPTKAAKPRRRAAASPKPARARKAPQRAARAPKVPARFRALGGVDPRTLPPGTPYPCSDGYVGAVVRGDKLAGRIVACATPPVGSRGQHFVLGKVASGRAISGEFRKGYKAAEKVAAAQRERARRDSIRTPEGPLPRAPGRHIDAKKENVLTLNVKGSRVTITLKGPKYRMVEDVKRTVRSSIRSSKAIYLDVSSAVHLNPEDMTGTFSVISTAGPVYGEVNRKLAQTALKSMAREAIAKKWCDRIIMGDGDDVTAMLTK